MILFYDTETTGLPIWGTPSSDPSQPHIVQIGAILVHPRTCEEIATLEVIVKPDGWEIPDEVAAIHGITTEQAAKRGIPEGEAIEIFLALWSHFPLRVAHNQKFDERILRIAIKRFQSDEAADAWRTIGEKACTCEMSKDYNPAGKKRMKLQDAYRQFFGVEFEAAHTALADARACKDVYFHMRAQ